MTLPTQEEFSSQLEEQESLIPELIEQKNLFWSTTPQLKALLRPDGAAGKGVKITSAKRRLTAEKLTYIRSIYFYCENPEKNQNSISISVRTIAGIEKKLSLRTTKTFIYVYPSDFCEWIEISSDAKLIKPHISKIQINGADVSDLEKYSSDINKYIAAKESSETTIATAREIFSEYVEKSNALSESLSELTTKIAEKNFESNTLTKDNASILKEIFENQKTLNILEAKNKHATETLTETNNNQEQLTEQTKSLNKQISNLRETLEGLTSDRNLISDEYGPYVKEGKSQARIYVGICILPLLAILFSIYEVYIGASKLLNTSHETALDVFAAFILRIPFAAVFGLAIYYSWKLTFSIIQKILKIHNDRLTLAKLLIIARETVHSSAKNLKISDNEKFQEQVSLKVEVLKSHLTKELGEDFKYTPPLREKQLKPLDSAANDKVQPPNSTQGFEDIKPPQL